MLPGGIPNEPETHIFLKRIIQSYPKPIIFIDIGASIGEFVFTMAKSNKVTYIYAFEPNEQAAKSMEITKLINNFEEKIKIYTLGISSYDGNASFYLNTRSPTGSKLIMDDFKSDIQVKQVKVSKLDSLFKEPISDSIILIDIEGGELEALKGAKEFISNSKPLIIFEYNEVTKSVFNLDQVCEILNPEEWFLFRLRKDGLLDQILVNTWNIVAVNKTSLFYNICMEMLK